MKASYRFVQIITALFLAAGTLDWLSYQPYVFGQFIPWATIYLKILAFGIGILTGAFAAGFIWFQSIKLIRSGKKPRFNFSALLVALFGIDLLLVYLSVLDQDQVQAASLRTGYIALFVLVVLAAIAYHTKHIWKKSKFKLVRVEIKSREETPQRCEYCGTLRSNDIRCHSCGAPLRTGK